MRNVFLLRGVILVTVFDTASAAARLAANILGIAATAVTNILDAVFRMVGSMLNAALAAFRFVANGVKRTIDALVPWIINTVGQALIYLGDTRVFRYIFYLMRILPNIMPPLVRLVRDQSLTRGEMRQLRSAGATPVPQPIFPGGPGTIRFPQFPDLSETLTPSGPVGGLARDVAQAGATLRRETRSIFGTAEASLQRIGAAMNVGRFDENYTRLVQQVRENAAVLSRILEPSAAQLRRQVERRRDQPTGLEAIARAYENWLSGGGLDSLLDRINQHFQRTPTTGPSAVRTLPGQVTAAAAGERPRATVEIENVTVVLEPPEQPPETSSTSAREPAYSLSTLLAEMRELRERGLTGLESESLAYT
jgi:hypothetical protein